MNENLRKPTVTGTMYFTRTDGSGGKFEGVIIHGPDSNRLAVSAENGLVIFESIHGDEPYYIPNIDHFWFELDLD